MLPETCGISTKDLKNSVVQAGATFLESPSADQSLNVDDQAKDEKAYIKPFFKRLLAHSSIYQDYFNFFLF